MNKKAMGLMGYMIALLLFCGLISGFYLVTAQTGGFWSAYGYAPSATDSQTLANYSQVGEINEMKETLACDINPESDSCKNLENQNVFRRVLSSSPITQMVLGGYDALITIYKSIVIPEKLVSEVGLHLGIPTYVVNLFEALIVICLIITIVYLIFNRSDSA